MVLVGSMTDALDKHFVNPFVSGYGNVSNGACEVCVLGSWLTESTL